MIVVEVIEGCASDRLIKYVQTHKIGHRFTGLDLPDFTAVQFSNACDFLANKGVIKKLKERRKAMNRAGTQPASFVVMEIISDVSIAAKKPRNTKKPESSREPIRNLPQKWDMFATPAPIVLGRGAIIHKPAM